jgi:hypothetical protein
VLLAVVALAYSATTGSASPTRSTPRVTTGPAPTSSSATSSAALSTMLPTATSTTSTSTTSTSTTVAAASPVVAVSGPANWQPGDFDDARVWVPRSWQIIESGSSSCSTGSGVLLLGTGTTMATCPTQATATVTVQTSTATPPPSAGSSVINGLQVFAAPAATAGSQALLVPALGVTLTVSAETPPAILASLGASPTGIVLGPGNPTPTPADWRAVTYHGLTIDVPASWPSTDESHAGYCDGPFGPTPEVLVGPNTLNGAPSCPYIPLNDIKPVDGVRLSAGTAPTSNLGTITIPSDLTLQVSTQVTSPPISLWYQGVSIELGIGPDPTIARAILDSLQSRPTQPDTPVQGVCPTGPAPSMPIPQRLAAPLTLEGGLLTLDPPQRSDQAGMSADQAWQDSGAKQPGETYQIILARYTSEFPATQNADGTLTPMNSDRLAWIVYQQPVHTSVGDCGLFGVEAFDATTGAVITQTGYSPGP